VSCVNHLFISRVELNADWLLCLIHLYFQLSNRQHFVDNADMYSLQDLVDLANDVLLPELTRIHASFAQHIKTDCQVSYPFALLINVLCESFNRLSSI